jgi:hypothetical protein
VESDLVVVFVAIFWREDYRGGRNAVTHDCRSNTANDANLTVLIAVIVLQRFKLMNQTNDKPLVLRMALNPISH